MIEGVDEGEGKMLIAGFEGGQTIAETEYPPAFERAQTIETRSISRREV